MYTTLSDAAAHSWNMHQLVLSHYQALNQPYEPSSAPISPILPSGWQCSHLTLLALLCCFYDESFEGDRHPELDPLTVCTIMIPPPLATTWYDFTFFPVATLRAALHLIPSFCIVGDPNENKSLEAVLTNPAHDKVVKMGECDPTVWRGRRIDADATAGLSRVYG